MNVAHAAVRLSSEGHGATLRWVAGPSFSLRAYELRGTQRSFCVSTRSAEWIVVLDGELCLELGPARQQVVVRPGQSCVLWRGTPHLSSTVERTKLLVFDIELGAAPEPPGLAWCTTDAPPRAVRPLLEDLWRQEGRVEIARLVPRLQALADELPRDGAALERRHDTRLVLEVKALIEGAYRETLRIETLARARHIDRSYLSRAFKDNLGVSPQAYLQWLRQEDFAWSLIRQDRRSLLDLAGEAGFGDYATFSRRIRRRFGRPPSRLVGSPVSRI